MTCPEDEKEDNLVKLANIVNTCDMNIRIIMETLLKIEEKLCVIKKREEEAQENNQNDDKEKMDKIFAKKQIGRPVGTWESKREQYADMLNKGKISQPKESTLEYYKIAKVKDTYVLIARDD